MNEPLYRQGDAQLARNFEDPEDLLLKYQEAYPLLENAVSF